MKKRMSLFACGGRKKKGVGRIACSRKEEGMRGKNNNNN
jgi:hypothetical protein